MDWPTNIPAHVTQRMRELHTQNVPKDYYGGTFWGSTGWFETDAMLDDDWVPEFAGDES